MIVLNFFAFERTHHDFAMPVHQTYNLGDGIFVGNFFSTENTDDVTRCHHVSLFDFFFHRRPFSCLTCRSFPVWFKLLLGAARSDFAMYGGSMPPPLTTVTLH
ncbi:MAG: hypothetical protein KDC32_20270, partial [Saprospiraceae bacterium]|nr:hypothetical protein [Saprospiraceae bacterium]